MKKTLCALWLTTLALTAAAQDFPMPAPKAPPMRVPMPSLAPTYVPATTPMSATTPMPSSVPARPGPAPNDNYPKSPALPPPPPPSLPVVVITQAIPCNVDMAYRKTNVDCAANVLRSFLTTTDLGSVPEANIEGAWARAVSNSARQNLSIADQDLKDGVSLMQSGNWSEAQRKLSEAYGEIEHLAEMSDYEKDSVRSLLEYSEAAEDLSHYDNEDAKAGFLRSYEDAQDPNTEAAALFSEAQAEIGALHLEQALQLLVQAYGQGARNLKSSILLAGLGVLTSLNGYNNPVADGTARHAIEDAESGQQKVLATLSYAALVHNVDPTRAKRILGDAEALCNSDAEWARNQRQVIEHFRQTWGG